MLCNDLNNWFALNRCVCVCVCVCVRVCVCVCVYTVCVCMYAVCVNVIHIHTLCSNDHKIKAMRMEGKGKMKEKAGK